MPKQEGKGLPRCASDDATLRARCSTLLGILAELSLVKPGKTLAAEANGEEEEPKARPIARVRDTARREIALYGRLASRVAAAV